MPEREEKEALDLRWTTSLARRRSVPRVPTRPKWYIGLHIFTFDLNSFKYGNSVQTKSLVYLVSREIELVANT